MYDTEEEARRRFAAAAGDIPPGIDLLRGVRARSTARRVRTRAVLSAATAAALAAGTLFAVTLTGPPSALAQVTGAAARTAEQSYQVSATMSSQMVGGTGKISNLATHSAIAGAFDPARRLGEETQRVGTQVVLETRYVGRYMYFHTGGTHGKGPFAGGKSWLRMPWRSPQAAGPPGTPLVLGAVRDLMQLNPQDLLGYLRSASNVQKVGDASGPGWTGTRYAFTSTVRLGHGNMSIGTSGTVDVDSQGRVRSLDVGVTTRLPRGAPFSSVTGKIRMTFGRFGAPVDVTAPAASDTVIPHLSGSAKGDMIFIGPAKTGPFMTLTPSAVAFWGAG